MNALYLQQSKEEYERAFIVYKRINSNNVKNFLNHLIKSLEFLSDGLTGKQVDMFDIINNKDYVTRTIDADFMDFYFYLYNLVKKEFTFISNTNIIVAGKKDNFKLSVDDFHDYLLKVRDYFNKAYDFLGT